MIYEAMDDKKAEDIVVLELRGLTVIADYFILCTAGSSTQAGAIASEIEKRLGKNKMKPIGIEGFKQSSWILMDYGDVIAHVFDEETRLYYGLERLWLDAPRVEFSSVDVKADRAARADAAFKSDERFKSDEAFKVEGASSVDG
jgi:ribosome-associated protein